MSLYGVHAQGIIYGAKRYIPGCSGHLAALHGILGIYNRTACRNELVHTLVTSSIRDTIQELWSRKKKIIPKKKTRDGLKRRKKWLLFRFSFALAIIQILNREGKIIFGEEKFCVFFFL